MAILMVRMATERTGQMVIPTGQMEMETEPMVQTAILTAQTVTKINPEKSSRGNFRGIIF